MTTNQDLRTKIMNATKRGDDLEVLVNGMRVGTDEGSSMLLAQLRMGVSVRDLVRTIRESKP